MPKLRHINPVGHADVPLLGREGGPVSYYECPDGNLCVERNGPDHEHELKVIEGSGPGAGCLEPGEEFEVSAEVAKALLEQTDNYELVKPKSTTEKKG